ncbi:unnamed protein product [Angiostrongylus costaricensis]|uniref:WD_REPEATS_REGION domain-containing protein n=1 Tax=Angiostrongylus costaricensis TaxID=334426 RepID=A0A0R3PFY7_ANGCS|nr:unnamed protein product [Angiostrongylus costaricensis]
MYERDDDMKLAVGSISAYPSNLSVCCLESKNITYACVAHKTQVNHRFTTDRSLLWNSFCRGITWNDNFILVGTSSGRIIQFQCNGETSIVTKKCLRVCLITDMATCRYNEVTCSCDCSGTIIVWNKCFKGVQLKMATQHPITVVNVLHKQVIVGTLRGRVLFFSISTGELIAEVFAHARSVTCVSVAPEAAYVLTGSEDGRFIVYKLHMMKAQTFQVEYRYCDELPNCAIMGAQFTNSRGSNIVVACFDRNALYGYHMVRNTAG